MSKPRRPDPFEAYTEAFNAMLEHLPAGEIGAEDRVFPSLDAHRRLVVRTPAGRAYILTGVRLGALGLDGATSEKPGVLRIIGDGTRFLVSEFVDGRERRRATVPAWIAKRTGIGVEAWN